MTTANIAESIGAGKDPRPQNDISRRPKLLRADAPPESARTTAPSSPPESGRLPPLQVRVREHLRTIPPGDMPREHRSTLVVLAGFDGPTGIHPSREAIEETLGISESTAKGEFRDLEAARWIRVDRTRKNAEGRQTSNGYEINLAGRWLPGGDEAPDPLPVVRLRDRRGTWEAVARGARKQPPQKHEDSQGGAQATPSTRGARARLSGGRAGAPDIDLDMQIPDPPLPPEPAEPPSPPATPPTAPRSGGPSGGSGQEQGKLFAVAPLVAAADPPRSSSAQKAPAEARYLGAFCAGIKDASGHDPAPTPKDARAWKMDLLGIAQWIDRNEGKKGEDLVARIRALAACFWRAIPSERVRFIAGGRGPKGCLAWLRDGQNIESAGRGAEQLPPLPDLPRPVHQAPPERIRPPSVPDFLSAGGAS